MAYDFTSFYNRFSKMSTEEVMQEYMHILRREKWLKDSLESGFISEDEFFSQLEPLSQIKDFVEGFLARLFCYQNGFVKIEGL